MADVPPRVSGTAAPAAADTRSELERAIRYLTLSDLDLRDHLLKLAAHVVALTDELVRRVDGVEPEAAPAGTPSPKTTMTAEAAVNQLLPHGFAKINTADSALGSAGPSAVR